MERDYVLAHVLAALTRVGHDGLVFKGGTALRYCYLDECRYSADLDFSVVDLTRDEAMVVVARALEDGRAAGSFEMLGLDERDPPRIRFVGPLGRERGIKLDVATDELVIDTQRVEIRSRWDDVESSGTLRVYSETEIGGEKLRCVIQRLQCRDLLDLDVVFEELAVDPHHAAARFEAKARHRGIDPEIFKRRYRERIAEYAERWDEELREHLTDVPHFGAIERRVSRNLRRGQLI
ncbi:MAG: nucleotidyl transferase AbiEii/AbiGii toxin family protein [Acidimicrobiia bacterium]